MHLLAALSLTSRPTNGNPGSLLLQQMAIHLSSRISVYPVPDIIPDTVINNNLRTYIANMNPI